MISKKKLFRDMTATEQIQHKEDLRALRALDKAAGIGEPMEITIQPCVFGHVLIASDSWRERLMAVELGATVADLMRTFINRWNKANATQYLFIGDKEPHQQLIDDVLKAVNTGVVEARLLPKLSIQGTNFQRKVLDSLLAIPSGRVETYQQVADRIDESKAARAIGNAVGANPIAIIIPCHRVVRADGKLGGYRWGEEIKKKLLEREKI